MAVDKLVDSTQLNTDLTDVANAIRTKGGTSAQLAFPDGFVSAVQAIPTGITPTGTKQISITENGTVTEDVTNYASAEITVDVQGGGGDSSLLNSLIDGTITSINYSGSTIRTHAFSNCQQLETISAPDVTLIRNNAFQSCVKLRNPVFPKVTSIANEAFRYSGIEEATITNFPLITSVSSSAFQNCSKLARVCLPNAMVGQQAFAGCTSLKTAVFKSFSYSGNFSTCSALEAADKTGDGNVAGAAFSNCGALTTLVLRSGTLCVLSNTSAFNGTPFASGGAGGTIYIHKALYDHLGDGSSLDYKAATNWSTIDGYGTITWAQIEGSIYETQYVDGTPIT